MYAVELLFFLSCTENFVRLSRTVRDGIDEDISVVGNYNYMLDAYTEAA